MSKDQPFGRRVAMRFLSLLLSSSLLLNQSLPLVSFSFTKLINSARYESALCLNRIFCDIDEVIKSGSSPDVLQPLILNLNETDYRYKHIKNILKLEAGDTLKGSLPKHSAWISL